jgi:hypothetical protein
MDVWLVGTGMAQAAKHMAPCGVVVVICEKVRPDTFLVTDRESAKAYVEQAQKNPFRVENAPVAHWDSWESHFKIGEAGAILDP